jgi:hypothetical protein
MKLANKWLRPEDHCCLPSPKQHLTRVAGLVFNFSRTTIPSPTVEPSPTELTAGPTTEPAIADPSAAAPSRRRPTSAGADDPVYERAAAR